MSSEQQAEDCPVGKDGRWVDCPGPLLALRVAMIAGTLEGGDREILTAAAFRLTRKVDDQRVREVVREEIGRAGERQQRNDEALRAELDRLRETLKLLVAATQAGLAAALETKS